HKLEEDSKSTNHNKLFVNVMLKRLDKIRFRGPRRDDFLDLAESPNTSDTEGGDETPPRPRASRDPEELRDAAGAGLLSMAAALQDDQRLETDSLNEVKGHLEIALLEKHFLQEELRKLREEASVEALRQELERERGRRLELEARALTARWDGAGWNGTWFSRLQKWLYERLGSYIEDFRFQPEEVAVETEEPLSLIGSKPVTNFLRNLSALSSWNSVYTSAIAFIIYMNAAWHGWVVPMFLFLAILRLSLNYLIARGWRIQWSIVPEVSEPPEPPKEELTVSEKFQLVLDVAQKAQNLFGKMADILEKIKNLFMWVQPEITQKLYVGLWVAFISSCLLPYKLLGFIIGVYAGIKFFVIDWVFRSCPKLRRRFDTPYVVWTSLPTDPQLKERAAAPPLSRRVPAAAAAGRGSLSAGPPPGLREDEGGRAYSTKRGAFHEVFNLPEDERPLAVCENGWRCCLINRDRKTPTDYIRNGVLYVTENYLCFESSSSRSGSSKRNKVIRLLDVTDVQKYKVLSVLPGSGMGISIATPSTQKPLVFGAMMHRDEAFDAIFTQYMKIVTMTTASDPET
uniref:GRAM domain containing 4 n=1 Tax=Myripristis murdjan TaxID=586833 RepID=A0A667YR61_9TELE